MPFNNPFPTVHTPRISVPESRQGSPIGFPNMTPEEIEQVASQFGNKPPDDTIRKDFPGGMANYVDDAYLPLLQGMAGGQHTEDTLIDILSAFKRKPQDLEQFMNMAQPFLQAGEARSLRQSDAMKWMEDQGNWDLGAMAGYGAASGRMAQTTQDAMQMGQNQLSQSGFGRGSARAALQQQGMQNLAAQQGDLWSRTYQQAQQNRMQSAGNVLDTHRMLSQMALGQQVMPRMEKQGGGNEAAIAQGLTGLLSLVALL